MLGVGGSGADIENIADGGGRRDMVLRSIVPRFSCIEIGGHRHIKAEKDYQIFGMVFSMTSMTSILKPEKGGTQFSNLRGERLTEPDVGRSSPGDKDVGELAVEKAKKRVAVSFRIVRCIPFALPIFYFPYVVTWHWRGRSVMKGEQQQQQQIRFWHDNDRRAWGLGGGKSRHAVYKS